MPIERIGEYLQTDDLSHVKCLGIESNIISNCVDTIKEKRIRGVFGAPCFGFREENLSFLKGLDWLETIWFWDISLKNIEEIYALKKLKHFGVHPRRPAIDFSNLPTLKKVIVEPKARDRGLEFLVDLDLLHIWHYKPNDKTFKKLVFPNQISELQLNWVNPSSLDTLQGIDKLKTLEIHRCRNLKKLGDLSSKYPHLERLVVDACGKVSESEVRKSVENCTNIKAVFLSNKCLVENA